MDSEELKFIESMEKLLKSKYFYIGVFVLVAGASLNYLSQLYLQKELTEGEVLPKLSDLILNKIPYYNLSTVYDLAAFLSVLLFFIFVIKKKQYNRVPYFLLLFGIVQIIRGIFIALTPFGNPSGYIGSTSIFHAFSVYDLGVYPSGHTGATFLAFLLAKGKTYKALFLSLSLITIIALLISRGHYSIDIFSGIIFAYATFCFGEKYFTKFKLN